MCGIFGVAVRRNAELGAPFVKRSFQILAELSESRGKDSSGLVIRDPADKLLRIFKGAITLNSLLKEKEINRQMDHVLCSLSANGSGIKPEPFFMMGHSRLVTNGTQKSNTNNQPVIKDGVIAMHNGIVVNEKDLWARHSDLNRDYEIDTEIMLALVRKHLQAGLDIPSAVSSAVNEVFGTVAAAFLFNDADELALVTNNGSLYTLTDGKKFFAFASEKYFLEETARRMRFDTHFEYCLRQLMPGQGLALDFGSFSIRDFACRSCVRKSCASKGGATLYRVTEQSFSNGIEQKELILDPAAIAVSSKAASESALLEFNIDRIMALRRCSKCLLPETFPFIVYDTAGVCNYCNHYVPKNEPKPLQELFDLVEPYRRTDGGNDCIIPYSGGRDSTHTLHIAKNILKLNPIAFTYDWGMVTDLARRNIARVCGKLGVENIIVAADIAWKRENIRKNIQAWLKKPHLGMVPLFMAGDKFFYYYADKVKKQTGIRLNIWGINPLENTDFKVGFLGVPPDHNKKRIYSLSFKRQLLLFKGVGGNVFGNPGYLNRSVVDTLGSFVSRSIIPHRDYYHMYDFYKWDEEEIEDLVLGEYRWEKAIDTETTWRIGDGTAPFYNYIYYTVAGFSEYDTFRSNQIREGALSREEGMRLVMRENRPRYPSIKWYTDIVGLDFASTIKRINNIPKLYP